MSAINLEQAREALKTTEQQKQQLELAQPLNIPQRHFGSPVTAKYQQDISSYNIALQQTKSENLPKLEQQKTELKTYISQAEEYQKKNDALVSVQNAYNRKGISAVGLLAQFGEGYKREYAQEFIKNYNKSIRFAQDDIKLMAKERETIDIVSSVNGIPTKVRITSEVPIQENALMTAIEQSKVSIDEEKLRQIKLEQTRAELPPIIRNILDIGEKGLSKIGQGFNYVLESKTIKALEGIDNPKVFGSQKGINIALTNVETAFPVITPITELIPRDIKGVVETGAFIYTMGKIPTQTNLLITGIGVSELREGDIGRGIRDVAFGTILPTYKYLKEPISILKEPKTSVSEFIEKQVLLLKDEQGLNIGKYKITKVYPERYEYITTRGKILLGELSPFKPKIENLDLYLKTYTEKIKISEPKVIVSITEPLIIKEGEILGSLRTMGREPVKVFTQTATPSRTEGIIISELKGKINLGETDLAKVNLRLLDKTTRNALKELGIKTEPLQKTRQVKTETLTGDIMSKIEFQELRQKIDLVNIGEPIKLQTGEVELRTKAKVSKTKATYTKETNIETKLINQDKIISKIQEKVRGLKEKPLNKLDKGVITSLQKSISKIEYNKEFGIIEEETLVGTVVVTPKIPKDLILTKEGKVYGLLKYDTLGRKLEVLSGKTERKTIQLEPSKERFTNIQKTEPTPSKFGRSVQDVLKEAGFQGQKQVLKIEPKQIQKFREEGLRGGKKVIGSIGTMQSKISAPRLIPKAKISKIMAKTITGTSLVLTSSLERSMAREITKPTYRETSKEISKEISREIPREITKEVPREVTKEIPREIVKEVPREVTKQAPKEIMKMISKEITKQVPKLVGYSMPKTSRTTGERIKYLLNSNINKKFKKQKKKAKKSREELFYTPDVTSIAFSIERKIRKKDKGLLIKNPPELRALMKVVK